MTEQKLEELQNECYELEKNNCEYFTFYKAGYKKGRKELEKENAELKEQVESLDNINIKAQNIIADLKAEIEKLKTCRNCNKEFTESCETCKRGLYDGKKDNWIIDKQL